MSADRDPFELLSRFDDPEPDPVIMNATIAQSREAFERQQSRGGQQSASAFGGWLQRSRNWLVPGGVGAFALVAAIVVAPGLLRTGSVDPGEQPVVADRPAEPSPVPTAPEQGVRMGMQPMPQPAQSELSRAPAPIFEGDNVRVGSRETSFALELYLPDLPGEPVIESQGLLTDEVAEITGAFQMPDSDLIAIQLQIDDARFWRVYRPVDGTYSRDAALSALVSDAPDQAEAERRLAAQ